MIKRIMEKLDVVEGQKFDIYEGSKIKEAGASFRDNVLIGNDGAKMFYSLGKVICGEYKVVKKPFVPIRGEDFYHVSFDGVVVCKTYNVDTLDMSCRYMGNCFENYEVAVKNIDKIKAKFNSIQYDLNEK